MQRVTRHLRPFRPVSRLQHLPTVEADGHFPAHGMPNGTLVVAFRVRTERGPPALMMRRCIGLAGRWRGAMPINPNPTSAGSELSRSLSRLSWRMDIGQAR